MIEERMVCRHCGRPIAVPASTCPWPGCGKTIMVICAACKQYTDVEGAFCQQCGEPLVVATFEPAPGSDRPQPILAELAADQAKAQLVASGVIATYATGFFFEGGQQRSALVNLFGAPLTPERKAEALIFGAVAYLVQQGYATLQRGTGRTPGLLWLEGKPWDGQERSLEGQLALRARLQKRFLEVSQQVVAELVGFRLEIRVTDEEGYIVERNEADLKALPRIVARLQAERNYSSLGDWLLSDSRTRSTQIRAQLDSSTAASVIERAWQTPLPPHEEAAACRETYQMLLDFVQGDPRRAEALALAIERVLHWFQRCEQHPEMVTYEL